MHASLTSPMPIVAILRGITTAECISVGRALYQAGIRVIEVPLNSPDAFTSISMLRAELHADCMVGAGTVLSVTDVQRTHEAQGELIVSPNVDVEVIRCALDLGMDVMPGFATATEAFQAIHAGASNLKLFPASTYGPQHLRALRAVLPRAVKVFPVGGVATPQVETWLLAGADGFGFGSDLFQPGWSAETVEAKAADIMRAVQSAMQPR